jgi:hypothetical protein
MYPVKLYVCACVRAHTHALAQVTSWYTAEHLITDKVRFHEQVNWCKCVESMPFLESRM